MIDIIIPAYNAHDTIVRALFSICLQDNNDKINVYIIDDASDKPYDYLVDDFKDRLKINVCRLDKNSGPGVARNKGLEISKSEFIMFLDSDDVLINTSSLMCIVQHMEGYDLGIGLLEFQNEDGTISRYQHHDRCLHGKVYRRSYLDKYNIRFYNSYRHEDASFHEIVLISNPKIYYSDNPTYLYLYNNKSVTHKKDGYEEYLNYKDYINATMYAINCSLENNFDLKRITDIALCGIMYLYYCYQKYIDEDYADELFTWIKPLAEFYLSNGMLIEHSRLLTLYHNFSCNYQDVLRITYNDFIKKCISK